MQKNLLGHASLLALTPPRPMFDAPKLKSTYDSIDDIPEEYRALYEEKDGKHIIIRIDGLRTDADVTRLQSALDNEKKAHKETKAKLQGFGEMTAEQLVEMRDELEELRARTPAEDEKTIDERVQKIVDVRLAKEKGPLERENKKLKDDLAASQSEATELKATITKGRISDAVRNAAAKHKIVPEAIEDVLLNAERVFEVDSEGKIVTRDNVGVTPGLEPDVWLGDMQNKRPFWWPQNNGGGANGGKPNGGAANNPWGVKAWNKSAQAAFVKEHGAAKAEQMAKSAGFDSLASANIAAKPIQPAA